MGEFETPNLELLLEVEPDLILAHSDEFMGTEDDSLLELLQDIAPTVQVTPYFTNPRQVATDVASILDEEQVGVLVGIIDSAIDDVVCAVGDRKSVV